MSIDKALYQAPKGIDTLGEDETPIEIEIVDPEQVKIGMAGMEVVIGEDEEEGALDFNENLAQLPE